jgi:hypothetical protein
LLPPTNSGYGPNAFGLSAFSDVLTSFSDVLTSFGGVSGQIELHSTDDTASIGKAVTIE